MNSPWLKFLPGKGRAGAKLPLPLVSVASTTGSHAVTTLAALRVFFPLLTLKQITLGFPSTVQGFPHLSRGHLWIGFSLLQGS